MADCSVSGCVRPVDTRGFCKMHYLRVLRTGAAGESGPRRNPLPDVCDVTGCSESAKARGWCDLHWKRWRKTGDPEGVLPRAGFPTGQDHPDWQGDDITYRTAHNRVCEALGPASLYLCVDCDLPASDWSYDNQDPDEKHGGSAYSTKIEHYQPRCRTCHRRFDAFWRTVPCKICFGAGEYEVRASAAGASPEDRRIECDCEV